MYYFRLGNTEINVEDLGTSYPGVCGHCGKTGIRYIAHVRQGLVNTLSRALDGDLVRDDESIGEMSAHVLAGKEAKQIDVGCVCVAKYLTDCGVDEGQAKRAQERVNSITQTLIQIAGLEASKAPEALALTISTHEIVVNLLQRYLDISAIRPYREARFTGKTEEEQRFYRLKSKAWEDYDTAQKRWKRENHSFPTGFRQGRTPTDTALVAYYTRKQNTLHTKIAAFKNRVAYV